AEVFRSVSILARKVHMPLSQSPEKYPPVSPLAERLNAAGEAMAEFRYEDAVAACEAALKLPRLRPAQKAQARCLLAAALEHLGRLPEAITALAPYESPAAREKLDPATRVQVCLRLGSARYQTEAHLDWGIALAREALKLAREHRLRAETGAAYFLLGRLYRRVGETGFAREFFLHARHEHRRAGEQMALIRDQIGLGIVGVTEGNVKVAEAAFDQAAELLRGLDEKDQPLLFGLLWMNRGTLAFWRGRLGESVALTERALTCFERVRQPRLTALALSNLGFVLWHSGEARRAKEVMEKALAQAKMIGARTTAASTLNNLGELQLVQGQFQKAESLIREGIAVFSDLRAGHVEAQAQINLGRCFLLQGKAGKRASEAFRASLSLSERIGDRRGITAAKLWLAENHLALAEAAAVRQLLAQVRAEIGQAGHEPHLPLIGHLRGLEARLALSEGETSEAIRDLEQAASVWMLAGNRCLLGEANFHLARACAQAGLTQRAEAALEMAEAILSGLGAQPMLARVRELRRTVSETGTTRREVSGSGPEVIVSALTRLLAAGLSRELLLFELTRLLDREFVAAPVIIYETADGNLTPLYWQSCDEPQAAAISAGLRRPHQQAGDAGESHEIETGDDHLLLYFRKGAGSELLSASLIELMIRQVRYLLAALRSFTQSAAHDEGTTELPQAATLKLLPPAPQTTTGLVYQSVAMQQLLDHIQQIRGNDITVLITGETGTGKELAAREVHEQSLRADRPFITFNCATINHDLAEAQLFGHRKGAFTGAHAASHGLIGEAEGGTLFLDEVGELPPSVQPKLLRFLENGEVRGIGETRTRTANVRIIAATNRDLEQMIAEGKFRADLWYRLNVVQL